MIKNLAAKTLYGFITNDFKGAFESIAANPSKTIGRGNFMLGKQAFLLLEFLSRLCYSDKSLDAIEDFSDALHAIEPRYFTELPDYVPKPRRVEFILPYRNWNNRRKELLWHLFDLVRNGQAHQYQQIKVKLANGKILIIGLTGAGFGKSLTTSRAPRPKKHLGFKVNSSGDIMIGVCPDVLFLDLEEAAKSVGLMDRGLSIEYLERKPYSETSSTLEGVLVGAGHFRIP